MIWRRLWAEVESPGERLRLAMRTSWHRAKGRRIVHFLHIGKTGGSAIKSSVGWRRVTPDSFFIAHVHAFGLADVPPGEKLVFFLRDPLRRFISGFYGRRRKDRPRLFCEWSEAERVAFEHFATPNALALALSSTRAAEREAAERAMHAIHHCNSPYMGWFGSADALLARRDDVMLVGRVERLAADFERLKARLHLPADLPLLRDPISAHRNPAGIDRRLDAPAVATLRDWYRDDYAFIVLCERHLGLPPLAPKAAAQFGGHEPG